MKNLFKSTVLSAISLICLTSCRLTTPSIEKETRVLKEAGYALTVVSGSELDTEDKDTPVYLVSGIEDCLYAKQDSEEIYLLYFPTADRARNAVIPSHKYQQGRINELIYIGTKQAIKDAKL